MTDLPEMPMPVSPNRRTIEISTEDGQRHILDYETEVAGADNAALDAEVRAKLLTAAIFHLPTLSDGSTATFYAPLVSITFFGAPAEPEAT